MESGKCVIGIRSFPKYCMYFHTSGPNNMLFHASTILNTYMYAVIISKLFDYVIGNFIEVSTQRRVMVNHFLPDNWIILKYQEQSIEISCNRGSSRMNGINISLFSCISEVENDEIMEFTLRELSLYISYLFFRYMGLEYQYGKHSDICIYIYLHIYKYREFR